MGLGVGARVRVRVGVRARVGVGYLLDEVRLLEVEGRDAVVRHGALGGRGAVGSLGRGAAGGTAVALLVGVRVGGGVSVGVRLACWLERGFGFESRVGIGARARG